MNFLFLINPVLALTCLVMALVYLRPKSSDWWTWFCAFLLLTTVVEWTGFYLYSILGQKNHWLYNLYLPLEVGFLLFAFQRITSSMYRSAYGLWVLAVAFLVMYGIECYQSNFQEYSRNANMIASFGIIVHCFVFYYFLMKQEQYVELTQYPPFWFISGLLVFFLGTVAINIFQQQLTAVYKATRLPIRYIMMLMLNFILYTSWSYAFICRSRQKISSN